MNPLVKQWSDYAGSAWAGVTSPDSMQAITNAALTTAAATAGAVAPGFGVPPNAAATVVATAPEAVRRAVTSSVEYGYWNQFKFPLLVGGAAALGIAAYKRSSVLAILGALALGGYAYGKNRFGESWFEFTSTTRIGS